MPDEQHPVKSTCSLGSSKRNTTMRCAVRHSLTYLSEHRLETRCVSEGVDWPLDACVRTHRLTYLLVQDDFVPNNNLI